LYFEIINIDIMTTIVIEGIDGAGGETQTKLLMKYFEKKKIPYKFLKSPQYELPVGKAIKAYLDEEFSMDPDSAFLLFCADNMLNAKEIEKSKKEKKHVILDRYITSTIVFQAARGFSFEKGIKFAELMEFPRADVIIFIDISPETSMKRKEREKGSLDMHEKDFEYLGRVRKFYLGEAKRNVLGKWFVIDGERNIEEVHENILRIVKKEVGIFKK